MEENAEGTNQNTALSGKSFLNDFYENFYTYNSKINKCPLIKEVHFNNQKRKLSNFPPIGILDFHINFSKLEVHSFL